MPFNECQLLSIKMVDNGIFNIINPNIQIEKNNYKIYSNKEIVLNIQLYNNLKITIEGDVPYNYEFDDHVINDSIPFTFNILLDKNHIHKTPYELDNICNKRIHEWIPPLACIYATEIINGKCEIVFAIYPCNL